MKFTFFHLMAWPHLADDFREKHHSVWVDVPNSLYDPARGHEVYHNYLDQLEYAEQCGFDGLGVNEHHSNAYGLMPSPNLMAATLTPRTSRAALMVLGNSIALGRARCSRRIPPFITPAAAPLKPAISASKTPIPTVTSATPAIGVAAI